MKYLLPCDQCGKEHEVDPSQAGESLPCQCGHTIEVPSLRGLRELKPAVTTQVRPASSRRSSELSRRLILVGGMLLIALGLIVSAYGGLIRMQIQVPETPSTQDPDVDASIDKLSPADAHRLWTKFRDEGVGPYQVPFHFLAELTQDYYTRIMIGGLILAGIGILLAGGALCMPSARSSAGKQAKRA
ncbi:MAG: hypothetical protein JJ992_15175 [Planctomycetes bacterium]|nr:hypothetical protein [Planctomycetota bacterium]